MKKFTCDTIKSAPKKYFGVDPEDPNAGKYTYIDIRPRKDCPLEVEIVSVYTYSPDGYNHTFNWGTPETNDDHSKIFCNEIGDGVYVFKKDVSIARFTEFTHMVLCWVRGKGRWWCDDVSSLRETADWESCPNYIVLEGNETLADVDLASDRPTFVQMLNEHDLLPLC